MEKQLAIDPDQDILNKIERVKLIIEDLDSKVVDGIIVRARTRWSEKGEKSNKNFLSLEKRNSIKKHCKILVTSSGTEVTEPNDILNAQRDYFTNIYKSKTEDSEYEGNRFFECKTIPVLYENDKSKCEEDILYSEYLDALNSMPKNKSPGNDGLPSEWYFCFWNTIGNFLIKVLNYGLNKGELSFSQKQAVITLIEKEGKDRRFVKNLRLISLLNTDYNIISKVLATRICSVIPSLIHSDQHGFVKGRFIGESVRTISDIKYNNIPGILLFLDFEKAFDSLEWHYLFCTLLRINFGITFVNFVKTLYRNISSCVMNNGLTSQYFSVQRGVMQGDPLSP